MRTKQLFGLAALLAALLLFLPRTAGAQSIVTGAVGGIVTDSSGAVIAGAEVTLKASDTGSVLSSTTTTSGSFQFTLLKPGIYTLGVSHPGFKQLEQRTEVLLGQITQANVKLEVGATSDTVTVTEQGSLLQTEDANISSNFDTHQIQNIPNPGNDITYVAQTAPGVSMNNSTGGGYGNFSAFGLPATSNLFTINGNDYNDAFLNLNNSGSSNLLLGGNELQEVAVVSNGYTGQYGRQAGAQIDYSTKSGTNSFHGDLVYNWTGRELTANDPVNKAFGGTRPFENNNQWAAAVGGPIIKNKAFFFVNTEGIRYIFGSVHTPSAPTPAFQSYRAGQRSCRMRQRKRSIATRSVCIMELRESPMPLPMGSRQRSAQPVHRDREAARGSLSPRIPLPVRPLLLLACPPVSSQEAPTRANAPKPGRNLSPAATKNGCSVDALITA